MVYSTSHQNKEVMEELWKRTINACSFIRNDLLSCAMLKFPSTLKTKNTPHRKAFLYWYANFQGKLDVKPRLRASLKRGSALSIFMTRYVYAVLSGALTIINRSIVFHEIYSVLVRHLFWKPRRNWTRQRIRLQDPIEVIFAARVLAPFVVSSEKRSMAGLDLLRGAVNLRSYA